MNWLDLAVAIGRRRPPVLCHEEDLQAWLADVFAQSGFTAQREVYLSSTDRVDFLVGRVAVEVKMEGSLPAILRQLYRYAASDQVDEILLVTTLAKHLTVASEVRGKRVEVVWVSQL